MVVGDYYCRVAHHERPREARGGNRGQCPRRDSCPGQGIQSFHNTARTLKVCVFVEYLYTEYTYNYIYIYIQRDADTEYYLLK